MLMLAVAAAAVAPAVAVTAGRAADNSTYPGKAPWRDAKDVFVDGEPVPGLSHPRFAYGFQIPILVITPERNVLAFAQAYVVQQRPGEGGGTLLGRLGASSVDGDGNDGWIDIVARRGLGSMDAGFGGGESPWKPGPLQVVFRNSSLATKQYHACQQPAPVVDHVTRKIMLISSLDNWHVMLQESTDDGRTFTPSAQARNLDATLRRPGWGLVFTGLPGGIQLRQPNPHAGRLLLCSSAYWTGGEMDRSGRIVKEGDRLSRYSYTIISDDHGATWRIGSAQVQPRHSTECSVSQSFDGPGDVFIYTRIWDKNCKGCQG
jgi:hypothetical protein